MTNLPIPLTSFIGREREMADVKQLLEQARLVTLTCAGGCGKTRLALQVASELLDHFPDGVWLVELASLAESARVPKRLAPFLAYMKQLPFLCCRRLPIISAPRICFSSWTTAST